MGRGVHSTGLEIKPMFGNRFAKGLLSLNREPQILGGAGSSDLAWASVMA